jgi:CDP-diacylglycerol pyrophosphatase
MGHMMKVRNVFIAFAVWMMATLSAFAGSAVDPLPGPTWTIQDKRAALWNVVQTCVKAASDGGNPSGTSKDANPCTKVDLADGYVIIKDNSPTKPYAFLLLPTDRITGIEDSELWVDDGPNYWRAAYENRLYVEKLLKVVLRPTQIGFAANSIYGRSQDQLHIHIGCVRPDVAALLAGNMDQLGDKQWTRLPALPGMRYTYRALLTADAALAQADPFRLLANEVYPQGSMLPHTLFMVGVTLSNGQPGFAFLDSQADDKVRSGKGVDASDWGAAEELLDDTCAIATGGGSQASQQQAR